MRAELVATFLLSGGVLVALSVPLLLDKVPPNGLYGVRVRATYKDSVVWYEANRLAGRDLLVVGLATIALTLVLSSVDHLKESTAALTCVGVLTLGSIAAAVRCVVFANRRYRERHGTRPS